MAIIAPIKRQDLPWKSRYTWDVRAGLAHPQFTYDFHMDAQDAELAASLMLRAQATNGGTNLVLREVHVKGPRDAESGWRRIELRC